MGKLTGGPWHERNRLLLKDVAPDLLKACEDFAERIAKCPDCDGTGEGEGDGMKRKGKRLKRLEDVARTESIINEIVDTTERLRTHKGWSYLPERIAVLKAQLAVEKNTAAKARGK